MGDVRALGTSVAATATATATGSAGVSSTGIIPNPPSTGSANSVILRNWGMKEWLVSSIAFPWFI